MSGRGEFLFGRQSRNRGAATQYMCHAKLDLGWCGCYQDSGSLQLSSGYWSRSFSSIVRNDSCCKRRRRRSSKLGPQACHCQYQNNSGFPFKAAKKTPAGKVTPGNGEEHSAVTTTTDAKAGVQIQVLVNECDIPDRTRHTAA